MTAPPSPPTASHPQLETARHRAEERLEQSEARFRKVFRSSLAALTITSLRQGRLIDFNESFLRLFGYDREEVLGRNVLDLHMYADPTDRARIVKELSEKGAVHNLETRIRTKSGEIRNVLFSSETVELEGEQCILGIIYDVTDRKRMEEALRLSEERYRRMVESIRDYAIFMLDPKGHVTTWNLGAERIKGYRTEEIIGRHFSCFYLPEDASTKPKEELATAVQAGRLEDEGWRVRKDGSRFWANGVITPLHGASGELTGFVKITRDLTAQQEAKEVLTRQAEELKRSNAELEQFAYVASHDLQEPLRMVASYTQLLAHRYQGKLDAEADEFIQYAVNGAARMQTLINDLLEYSRVSMQTRPFEWVETQGILDRTLSNLGLVIDQAGAVVTHGELPLLRGDASQLTQVFQNLLSNALKFRGNEPPQIHVSAQKKGDEWFFSVRDNGIGFNARHQNRIFVLFQRLHGSKYPGTGMGLAICKKIVERHGGRIWAESAEGKGSTFYFTIPISGGAAP